MLSFLGSLIGAGASLFGGQSAQQNQEQINQQNIAAQQAINNQNIAEQEKFAQQGVSWRVQDARNAGINPLAALGASTSSFSNVVAPQAQSSNAFGTGVANAGQDISRAIQATRTPEDQAIATEKTRLDLESSQLDNDIKRASLASSIARTSGAQVGPGLSHRARLAADNRQTPAANSDSMLLRTADGRIVTSKSPTAQATGFDWLDDVQWQIRNRLPQFFGYHVPPGLADPAPGYKWVLGADGVWSQVRTVRQDLSDMWNHPGDYFQRATPHY